MLEGIRSETALCSPRLIREAAQYRERMVSEKSFFFKPDHEPSVAEARRLIQEALTELNFEESRSGYLNPRTLQAQALMRAAVSKL